MTRQDLQAYDEYERPLPGAKIYVYNSDDQLASLFDANGDALTQPLETNIFGAAHYYAADGIYRHEYWFGGRKVYVEAGVGVGALSGGGTVDLSAVNSAIAALQAGKVNVSSIGQAGGIPPLGLDSKIPLAYIPTIPGGGGGGAITSVNGQTGVVNLGKTDVGLGNVDNTSDANKPVSTATQAALNGKEASIAAGTSAQYYRGDKTFQTLNKAAVGLSNVDNTSDANKPVSTSQASAIDARMPKTGGTMLGALTVPEFLWALCSSSGNEAFLGIMGHDGARLGAMYRDKADGGLKFRRYSGTVGDNTAAGELAIYNNDVRFNNVSILGGGGGGGYTDEQVRDVVNAAFAAGTHSGITVTTSDAGESISLSVTGGGSGTPGVGFIDPGASNGSNDEAALMSAAQAAQGGAGIINGMGRTYRINGDFVVNGLSGVEFQNCQFVQAAASSGSYKMFHVTNANGWTFRKCRFEIGTLAMAGWGGLDSSYGLLIEGGAAHRLIECEVFGYGKGAGMGMKYVRDSWIESPNIHDLTYSDSGVSNDTIEGIDLTFCANVHIVNPRIKNLRGNGQNISNRMVDGDFIAIQHTRGISISGSNDITIANPNISFVGQGIDVSGDEGNHNVVIIGGRYKMCALFAEKFANSASFCKSEGAHVDRVGYAGVVCSGVGSAMAATKSSTHTTANPDLRATIESTRNITINGLTVFRPGYGVIRGDGSTHFSQRAGGLILSGGNTDLSPHGIRFNNTVVIGGGTVNGTDEANWGVTSDAITNNGNPNNEFNTQIENVSGKSANFHNDFS